MSAHCKHSKWGVQRRWGKEKTNCILKSDQVTMIVPGMSLAAPEQFHSAKDQIAILSGSCLTSLMEAFREQQRP